MSSADEFDDVLPPIDDNPPDLGPEHWAPGMGTTWCEFADTEPRGVVSATEPGRTADSLPLGPPGRGAGSRARPEPTREGFDAAKATEKRRNRSASDMDPADLKEWDLAKLEALNDREDELTDWEREAFPSMQERLERGRFPLTEKQRAIVDKACDKLGLEIEPPTDFELPGMGARKVDARRGAYERGRTKEPSEVPTIKLDDNLDKPDAIRFESVPAEVDPAKFESDETVITRAELEKGKLVITGQGKVETISTDLHVEAPKKGTGLPLFSPAKKSTQHEQDIASQSAQRELLKRRRRRIGGGT